jgi:heme/copper-type cytochrome/quinol oxidase subunit 2
LCGLYHAFMNNKAAVVTPQQFAQWLESQGASPSAAATAAGTPTAITTSAKS